MSKHEWSKRPSVTIDATLGRRQRWRLKSGGGQVERFPDSSGEYIAIGATGTGAMVLKRHRKLGAAKRTVEVHAKEIGCFLP